MTYRCSLRYRLRGQTSLLVSSHQRSLTSIAQDTLSIVASLILPEVKSIRSIDMDSSQTPSHVCTFDSSPDGHDPSPCDLYHRMVMQERLVMECKRRNKCQRLIRRGWASIKATVAKWEEGLKERKGRLFDRLRYQPILFLTYSVPLHRSSPPLSDLFGLAPCASDQPLPQYCSHNPPYRLLCQLNPIVHRFIVPNRELHHHPHR